MAYIDDRAFKIYIDGQDRMTAEEYMRDREVLRQAINDLEDKYSVLDPESTFGTVREDLRMMNTAIEEIYTETEGINIGLYQRSLNLRDYGAVGDGQTDDTQAFRDVLRVARDSGAVNVYVPEGTYVMNSWAEIFSNTYIRFAKGAKVIKGPNSNTAYIFLPGKSSNIPGYGGGAKNITIEGGEFEGYGDNIGISITSHHVENLVCRDAVFKKAITNGHVFDLGGCKDVLIENCYFIGMTLKEGREYTEAIQLDYSSSGALSKQFQAYDGLPTINVTVKNCKFLPIYNEDGTIANHAPNPIGCHSIIYEQYFRSIKFIDNLVIDSPADSPNNTGTWLRFYAVDGMEISGNKFINTKSIKNTVVSLQTKTNGLLLKDVGTETEPSSTIPVMPCKNVTVERNTFDGFNSTSAGFPIVQSYGQSTSVNDYNENIIVRDNVFTNNWPSGAARGANQAPNCIEMQYTKDIVIEGNTAKDARRLAYMQDCIDMRIINNLAQRNNNLAMSLGRCKRVWVINNSMVECTSGFYTWECTDIIVLNNILEDNYDDMYTTYGAIMAFKTAKRATIGQNILKNKEGSRIVTGIHAYTNASELVIIDNQIFGFTKDIDFTAGLPNISIRRPFTS
ncbi:MAG: glycosyl hydrolase family 28-related protein [Ruminococcus sp.]